MMLVIYGPTVTGKTNLAIKLAQKYNGELISADSRQVYKGLDIGTGKVNFESKTEKHQDYWIVDGVKVHGFDLLKPGKNFSAADFVKFASNLVRDIKKQGKFPIIVGGTGFYIKSYLYGFDTLGIPADLKLRKRLEKLSASHLYQKLLKINSRRAHRMNDSDRQNPRRLIRVIEILSSKSTIQSASPAKRSEPSNYPSTQNYLLIGLTAPNEYLYERADKWFKKRFNQGLIIEVDTLIRHGVSAHWLENLGLEYRWITRYVQGKISVEQTKKRLKGDIHEFIRRQKTFFNQFADIQLFDISKENWLKELEKTVSTWYNQQDGRIYSSS